jgi:hypothetical protein
VILFTGRLPYSLAVAQGFDSSGFEYIPHEGTDLFRALNMMALSETYRGSIPRLSFDSMPEHGVAEAYADLGLECTYRLIPLEVEGEAAAISTSRIVAAHRAAYATGEVEHCATCIYAVFQALAAEGLPSTRIGHSRMSVRHALLRAQLLLELDRAAASQFAVGVLRKAINQPRKRGAISLGVALEYCAELLGGRVLREDRHEGYLLTTRGSIERAVKARASLSPEDGASRGFVLGIGTGPTTDSAEARARQACERASEAPQGLIRLSPGLIVPFASVSLMQAREIRRTNVKSRQDLQISPSVIRRLGLIFRELDPTGFTADELARGYKVQPRSARRLIALLRARGLVQECGVEGSDRAGRPRHVYRILLDRIASAQEPGLS